MVGRPQCPDRLGRHSSVIGKRMKSGFAVKFRSLVASQEVKLLTAALRQGVRVVKKIGMSEASRGAM
jgi:hypothetical protein